MSRPFRIKKHHLRRMHAFSGSMIKILDFRAEVKRSGGKKNAPLSLRWSPARRAGIRHEQGDWEEAQAAWAERQAGNRAQIVRGGRP